MIRKLIFFVFFFIAIVFFAILSLFTGLLFKEKKWATYCIASFGKVCLKVAGVKLDVHGQENLDRDRPTLYMANHSSIMDIAILPAAVPVDLRFVFKHTLGYIPVVGWAMIATGMIPIRRGSKGPAMKSIRKAAKQISEGAHIIIFPEGTRTRTGELGTLKKGGFLLANMSKASIVPVHISQTSNLCHRNLPWVTPGTLTVTIHSPITPEQYGEMKRSELIQQVQSCIQN